MSCTSRAKSEPMECCACTAKVPHIKVEIAFLPLCETHRGGLFYHQSRILAFLISDWLIFTSWWFPWLRIYNLADFLKAFGVPLMQFNSSLVLLLMKKLKKHHLNGGTVSLIIIHVTLSKRLFSSAQLNGFLTDILMSMSVHQYNKFYVWILPMLSFAKNWILKFLFINYNKGKYKGITFSIKFITLLSHTAKNI
jgi:hypothetical protein